MTDELSIKDVDALAQEIRRVDGAHSLGAGALAEALAPYLRAYAREAIRMAQGEVAMWAFRRAGSDEAWRPCFNDQHRANTEASPEWEVAALYRTSPPAGEVA